MRNGRYESDKQLFLLEQRSRKKIHTSACFLFYMESSRTRTYTHTQNQHIVLSFFLFFFSFLPKHEAQFLKDTFRRDNTIIPSDGNEDYNILIE